MRWRPQILLAVVLAVGAWGCSDDDPSTVERADVTTSTTEEATSTTAGTTTTTLAPCDPLDAPSDGGDATTAVRADVDGDGVGDEIRSHASGEDGWRLEVELGRGGEAALDLQTFGGPFGVLGGADVDGDGADEVWARTGAGASTTIIGLFRVEGCELVRATFATGGAVELPVGGSVGTSTGVECDEEGGLVAYTASYVGGEGGDVYDVEAVRYELDGSTLVEGDRDRTEVSSGDEEFRRYTSFSCGELTL